MSSYLPVTHLQLLTTQHLIHMQLPTSVTALHCDSYGCPHSTVWLPPLYCVTAPHILYGR